MKSTEQQDPENTPDFQSFQFEDAIRFCVTQRNLFGRMSELLKQKQEEVRKMQEEKDKLLQLLMLESSLHLEAKDIDPPPKSIEEPQPPARTLAYLYALEQWKNTSSE